MDNQKIADIFDEIGSILEIQGDNPFRINAYFRAARTIAHYPKDLRDIYLTDPLKLEEIPGIGKDLAAKIIEILKTGKCKAHQELVKKFPKGLLEMLRLRGVGPKKVKLFFGKLGIQNVDQLKKAAQAGKLRKLPKMGEKSEQEILKAIEEFRSYKHERRLLHEALQEANKYVEHMKKCNEIDKIEPAGSLRRRVETIGDIDILTTGKHAEKIMDHFLKYPEIANVIGRGPTKSTVLLKSGVQVDLRVLDPKTFGAALHYFTGSKEHNIRIRDLAKRKGLKISEYGVFKVRGEKEILVGGKTEEEVFKFVGFPFIPPEFREDRGEIEWALAKKPFPELIELKDLRGDLHCHTKWSDGSEELEDVVKAYKKAGYEYMAITDHSKAIGITGGLTAERIKMQWDEIDKLNKELKPFKILKGSEVDILRDGKLDFPDAILKKLDMVVGSVHLNFKMSEEEQTKRIIRAIESGFMHILGHPTGRLIHQRNPYQVNMKKVIEACVRNHVALEINASPTRLDLNDTYVKMAKDLGAKFVISTDSHHSSQMQFQQYGVFVARRGWLTKNDVLNTLPLEKIAYFSTPR